MVERYVMGLDVGTTGTKALVLDSSGSIVGQGYHGYPLQTSGSHVEQNPDEWWKACIAAARQAVPSEYASRIEAISLSTQGASMVLLDNKEEPIGNAITWLDSRSLAEAGALEKELGASYIYATTGWRTSSYLDAAKIMHVKTHPEEYKKAARFVSTLEYINYKLTGHTVIDPTNAAIRQLFNISTGSWDEKIMAAVGVTEAELPSILPTGALVGTLTGRAAEALGLSTRVKVFNGAHDQYCASLGSGTVLPGEFLVSTGTAWVVMGISEKPLFSPSCISPCPHPIAGLYGNLASLSGIGNTYKWIVGALFPGESLSVVDAALEKIPKKNEKLFFVPWLSGSGYPMWNPEAKGSFHGLDFSVTRNEMALAVLESAAFSLRNAIDDFEDNGMPCRRVRIMGGATRSRLWMGLLKAVLGVPLYQMDIPEACALGAAFIAARHAGWFEDYGEFAQGIITTREITSGEENPEYYEWKQRRYKNILDVVDSLYRQEK